MKKSLTLYGRWLYATVALGFVLFAGQTALAQVSQLSEYSFSAGVCSEFDMSTGATTILGTNVDDGLSAAYNIGFSFTLGGSNYTQFKANTNGYMTVGTNANSSGCCGNIITSLPANDRPAIVPFSEDLHNGSDGYVSYKLFGTAPNRILVVHWQTRQYPGSGQATHTTMQARLYETSNKVELWYGASDLGSGNQGGIGVIVSASNYASVNTGVVSYTSAQRSDFPSEGTCYSFTPCQSNVGLTGNLAQGGTTGMADGDSLLVGVNVMRGSSAQRMPFTVFNGNKALNACATRTYTYTIDGPYASEYTITPVNGSLPNGSASDPVITFTPGGTGLREATLTVMDDAGLRREFKLHGSGLTRISWKGNLTEGGTPNVLDQDTLINALQVEFGSSKTFTPLTIEDINLDPLETPPADITYTLVDPLGNYSINPTSTQLNGGQQSLVEITFTGAGVVGVQEATLIVNADGETRTYLLRAFNAAPGGQLFTDRGEVSLDNPIFVEKYGCVGSEAVVVEVRAVNTGAGDFVIRGAEVFQTDTVIQQGTPRYPLLRDRQGRPSQTLDYFVTNNPGIAPKANNQPFDSIIIPEGQSRTFYLNMVATRPGKRFGIIFFRTNAFNLEDPNIDGVPTRGMLRTGAYGRGLGSFLSGTESLKRPAPVTFTTTEVRESEVKTAVIRNEGNCDLRINRSKLRLHSGDLDEFELLSILPNTVIDGDDYLIPAGAEDSITVRFSPKSYGSRLATVRFATNDSTLGDGATVEFGTYYMDLYGQGSIGLEARGAQLPPAVIDGESSRGFVLLENTSATSVEIESITIVGTSNEFIEDATRPWPSIPVVLIPGEKIRVWVELVPDGSLGTGERTAEVVVQVKGGDEARVVVRGYVGSRTLSVVPGALFEGLQVGLGELVRRNILISNVGTLPVRLNEPVLVETFPGDYIVSPLARRVLEPGQTEIMEITYVPQAVGVSSGTLTFSSNATNGDQVMVLGGEATGILDAGDAVGSSVNTRLLEQQAAKSGATATLSMSSVVPNPARGVTTVEFNVAEEGSVNLALYDESGRLVKVLAAGAEMTGEQSLELDVTSLSSGTYHLVLQQGTQMVSHTLKVVK